MDIKSEITIEEEEIDMNFTYPHEDLKMIPSERVNWEETHTLGEVNRVQRSKMDFKGIKSSDIVEDYRNSPKDVAENDCEIIFIAKKKSRKEGSENLDNLRKPGYTLSTVNFDGRIKSDNGKRRNFKCSKCNYVSHNKGNLNRHTLIHSEIKLFKCPKCNHECNQKSNLKSHMLIHSNNKLFKCSECSYCCNRKANMTLHMLNHKEIKLFKCTECNYECNRKNYLAKHVLIHNKIQLFKCSHCDVECERKSHLRRHMLVHSKTKLLRCSECRYECNYKVNLQKHMLIHKKMSENEDGWLWSYKENEYLMECYYVGEAILAKAEKTLELCTYIKQEEVNSNDLMEYMFKLKNKNLKRKALVKQKHRILFNVIKERQEYKKKVHYPSEEELERIKRKAKQLVENEFEPSLKLLKKVKQNVEKVCKKTRSYSYYK